MAHFIPLPQDGKTASGLAMIFAHVSWYLHGLPSDIVSDRDLRFTLQTWQEILQLLGIWSRMPTAFHPQTDGQMEQPHQTIETYLRSFVNHEQDDWVSLLPIAEFAYINSVTTPTSILPFYANYGFHPMAVNPTPVHTLNLASKVYAQIKVLTDGKRRTTLSHERVLIAETNKAIECCAESAESWRLQQEKSLKGVLCSEKTGHQQQTGPRTE